MKKIIIILILLIGGFFINFILNKSKTNNSGINIVDTVDAIDYLIFEDGNLYCEFGDKNNQTPNVGTIYSKEKVEVVEFPDSLGIISYLYAKDKKNVYSYESFCTTDIPGSCDCFFNKLNLNSNYLKMLNDDHIKDNNIVIVFGEEIKEIDAKTFTLFKTNDGKVTPYGKDKNNIYYYGEVIEEADYSSFEVVDSVVAKDKNHVFNEGF